MCRQVAAKSRDGPHQRRRDALLVSLLQPRVHGQAGHPLRHGIAHGHLHGVLRPGAGVVGFYMRRLDGGLALTPALSRGERE